MIDETAVDEIREVVDTCLLRDQDESLRWVTSVKSKKIRDPYKKKLCQYLESKIYWLLMKNLIWL